MEDMFLFDHHLLDFDTILTDALVWLKPMHPYAMACPVKTCGLVCRYADDLKNHVQRNHPRTYPILVHVMAAADTSSHKPFDCPLLSCPSGFTYKRDLVRHMKIKHPILLPYV